MVRLLQPLQPQSPARVAWETRVAEHLCERWECDHGDATGFLDANTAIVDELYLGGANPRSAAEVLDCMD